MEEILRFEHVSYAYEEEREALLDVCVKVCAGERVAVLGSNGAGKSTFFLLANGVLRPGAGRILFRGAPVGGGAKQLNVLRRGVCSRTRRCSCWAAAWRMRSASAL